MQMNSQQDIRIEVAVRYLTEQSDPDADRYAFAYTVEICNRGMEAVKLLNRYWHITDDNEKVEEVRGEGVIGQQPEILPGQSFHYSSVEKFTAKIPPFLLAPPLAVH